LVAHCLIICRTLLLPPLSYRLLQQMRHLHQLPRRAQGVLGASAALSLFSTTNCALSTQERHR
jgi:hypothetical protein